MKESRPPIPAPPVKFILSHGAQTPKKYPIFHPPPPIVRKYKIVPLKIYFVYEHVCPETEIELTATVVIHLERTRVVPIICFPPPTSGIPPQAGLLFPPIKLRKRNQKLVPSLTSVLLEKILF